ncbi:Hypothetical predicted protein [Prunus dulcis]|uniref:Uncharacterized protein n=1 Tax=Prunus dulcis TaxID=3755 RepID=A0A5E4EJT6_PRUDU|nr:Hypothetical predicted protein [Prunus dulcis]
MAYRGLFYRLGALTTTAYFDADYAVDPDDRLSTSGYCLYLGSSLLTLTRPKLWCDNISAIFLASNPVFHTRTRHVEVDYHYIREKVVRQKLEVGYLLTHDQIADIFTKGLSSHRFRLLVDKLHVRMVQQNQVHLGEEECKLQE